LSFAYKADAHIPERWFSVSQELWPDERDVVEMLQEIFRIRADTRPRRSRELFMLVGPARRGRVPSPPRIDASSRKHNTLCADIKEHERDCGLEPLIGKQLAIISDFR